MKWKKWLAGALAVALFTPAMAFVNVGDLLRADTAEDTITETRYTDPSDFSVEYAVENGILEQKFEALSDEVVKIIYDAAMSFKESVNVEQYGLILSNQFWLDLHAIQQNNPELFFLAGFSVSYNGAKATVYSISFIYNCDQTTAKQMQAEIDVEAAKALARIDSSMSDWQKVLVLHDWLADHVAYSDNGNHSFDMYGALACGVCVCEGYTKAFTYLARRAGLSSYYAYNDSINHAWNVVLVDGKYYNVDVTWDDPTTYYGDRLGQVFHNYLLLDNATMLHAGSREHPGPENIDAALLTNKEFVNAPWNEVESTINIYRGNYYFAYFEQHENITEIRKSSNILTSLGSRIVEFTPENGRWWTSKSSFMVTPVSMPELYNHYLIFNTTDTIEYIDLDDASYAPVVMYASTEIPSLSIEEGYGIREFTVEGDELHYCVFGHAVPANGLKIEILPNLLKDIDPEPDPQPIDPQPIDPQPVDPQPVDPQPVDPTNPDPTNPNPDPTNPNPDPTNPQPTNPDPTHEPNFGDFIDRLYRYALLREPEETGKAFWMDKVMNEGFTGGRCAYGFLVEAPEFLNRDLSNEQFIDTLYLIFFERAADEGGKAFWLDQFSKGMTRAQMVNGFIDSTEWCNLCASYGIKSGAPNAKAEKASKNAEKFAMRLYTECLGRDYDPSGLEFWALRLTNLESSGYEAALGFFTSDEFKQKGIGDDEFIHRLYRTFMGRDEDPDGFAFWKSHLGVDMTREELVKGFAQSQEFTNICNEYGIDKGI